MNLFSWASVSEAIDDQLTKLVDCHGKWKVYERHREEVTSRVTNVEELVGSYFSMLFDTDTELEVYFDRIQVCLLIY